MHNFMDLQRFAEGGTLVNATNQYVNAYDGTYEAFSGSNTLSPENKTFYNTALLENAKAEMVHSQFAKRTPLPRGNGKTVEWRKFNTIAPASQLTEGVIPTGQKLGMSTLTDEVSQYGTYVAISDMLDLTAIDPVAMEAQVELSASAGRTEDELCRNDLMTGTNVLYAQKMVSGVATDVSQRSGLDMTAVLTPDTVKRAKTKLKKLHAPTIDGKYVAIIHPSVAYDLTSHKDWIEYHKYAGTREIFSGEIGELDGVRFVESTQAKVFRGADLASNSRTLAVNAADGLTAATTIPFDGGTVAQGALVGRKLLIGNKVVTVVSNTASAITVGSADAVTCADNTVIYPGEAGATGLSVYATLFLGKDAFGCIDLQGGGLQMILHSASEAGGPLDQFSTVGYKLTTNGAKVLYEDRMVRVESCSHYSDEDVAN